MADLSITASQVLRASGTTASATAGEAITAGQPVYLDVTDANKAKRAQATTLAKAAAVGVALHGAESGQPVTYQRDGVLTLGAAAAPVAGITYVVSGLVGGWSPHTDPTTPASTEFSTVLGTGIGSNQVRLGILVSGAQVA